MTVTIDGVGPHEEDSLDGLMVRLGESLIAIRGSVPRCAAVTHDPQTGERDHPVLKGIVKYRRMRVDHDGRKVNAPFGMYGYVERPGRIRVGDRLTVIGPQANGNH